MGEFKADFRWQMRFYDEMRYILGPRLLIEAPDELDFKQATDMLILAARDMRIGCRVRRPQYLDRYPWDFTIRRARDSGATTEAEKIWEGWGDWLFYAFSDAEERFLARWFIVDLDAFRSQMREHRNRVGNPRRKDNGDGTYFVAFDVRRFRDEPPILVDSSHGS